MVRSIIVVKRPRDDPIPDKPINFPPLENLHLELLENKRKLKPGLPLVPLQKRKPPRPKASPPSPQGGSSPKAKAGKTKPPGSPAGSPSKSKKTRFKDRKKSRKPIEEDEDAGMLAELGEDDVDPVELHLGEDEEEIEFAASDEEDIGDDEFADEVEEEPEEDDPYAGLSPEEREAKEKEEYIWRFRILKKQYKTPQVDIPNFNEHSDLQMMKTTYDRTIRELYLDDAVETYRTYLVGGFIVMEFVCTQWVGVDLSGFTIQQTRMMYKYDRLLIELGEKSYNRWGMNLPVEIRLIGFILLQAGIFYLGKIISTKFGNSVAELFKGITGQPPDRASSGSGGSPSMGGMPASGGQAPQKKKRMRGPKIRPEDIRSMHAQEVDSP